ncbi:hypothetical protein HZC30_07495 [Candidatus Woesearchaeota archaeon]|nr:hypothetical protein [Candidatus Woesearchaeota archaeon]
MIEIVNLVKLIEESDFVLLDASIFPGNRHYEKDFINAGNTLELEQLCPEIKNSLEQWSWMNKNIIPHHRVYTIPEVVEELKLFRNILLSKHRHCRQFGIHKKYRRMMRNKVEPWAYNPEIDEEMNYQDNFRYKPTTGLTLLDGYSLQVTHAIKTIKQYIPQGYELPKLTKEDVSATDYHVVEAGIEYLIAHPNTRTGILTRDTHLIQILDYFLDQNPPLPAGEIGIYRFTSGKIWETGTGVLREAAVSESEPHKMVI